MRNTFYNAFDSQRWDDHEPDSKPSDTRQPFEIDRDRVIHSAAFRRLQSKTQVFLAGEYDFYRTRLTHSIEVAQIGRSICRHLERSSPLLGPDFYIDADLVEAVCLAHDLGHPPFGHAGERTLNRLMEAHGGFEGNAQTLRLLTQTIYGGNRGLKPTRAFLDGVLKYKTLRSEWPAGPDGTGPDNHFLYDDQQPVRDFVFGQPGLPPDLAPGPALNRHRSIECRIMDWADDTAYSIHDVVDSLHAGFLDPLRIERWAAEQAPDPHADAAIHRLLDAIRADKVEPRMERRIGAFITATTLEPSTRFLSESTNRHRFTLAVPDDISAECRSYQKLAADCVFRTHRLKQLECKGDRMLTEVFAILRSEYLDRASPRFPVLPPAVAALLPARGTAPHAATARLLCDYLAGMTDAFAARFCRRLTDPAFGGIGDLV